MNIGDKVIIRECHAIPQLVGLEAKIIAMMDPQIAKYPVAVVLTGEPLTIETRDGQAHTQGPFPFRADELELVGQGQGQPQANADNQPGKTGLPKFLDQMGEEPQV